MDGDELLYKSFLDKKGGCPPFFVYHKKERQKPLNQKHLYFTHRFSIINIERVR